MLGHKTANFAPLKTGARLEDVVLQYRWHSCIGVYIVVFSFCFIAFDRNQGLQLFPLETLLYYTSIVGSIVVNNIPFHCIFHLKTTFLLTPTCSMGLPTYCSDQHAASLPSCFHMTQACPVDCFGKSEFNFQLSCWLPSVLLRICCLIFIVVPELLLCSEVLILENLKCNIYV